MIAIDCLEEVELLCCVELVSVAEKDDLKPWVQ